MTTEKDILSTYVDEKNIVNIIQEFKGEYMFRVLRNERWSNKHTCGNRFETIGYSYTIDSIKEYVYTKIINSSNYKYYYEKNIDSYNKFIKEEVDDYHNNDDNDDKIDIKTFKYKDILMVFAEKIDFKLPEDGPYNLNDLYIINPIKREKFGEIKNNIIYDKFSQVAEFYTPDIVRYLKFKNNIDDTFNMDKKTLKNKIEKCNKNKHFLDYRSYSINQGRYECSNIEDYIDDSDYWSLSYSKTSSSMENLLPENGIILDIIDIIYDSENYKLFFYNKINNGYNGKKYKTYHVFFIKESKIIR